MESSSSTLRERAVQAAGAALLIGGIALGGAGCSSPEQAPDRSASYDIVPGASDLPVIPSANTQHPNTTIDTRYIASKVDPDSYTQLYNLPPKDTPREKLGSLPDGESAPVLDVLLGKDGKLHYKSYSYTPDSTLLDVVSAATPQLGPAMRSGKARQVHFRVFKPGQYADEPTLQPRTEFLELPQDYNDEGKPAIYVFLEPSDRLSTEAATLLLRHEASHRLLDQDRSIAPSPEEFKTLTAACAVMQKNALQHVAEDSTMLTSNLLYLKQVAPNKYGPVFQELIDAIKNATYNQLPMTKLAQGEVPDCFLQEPWSAIAANVKSKGINGGDLEELMDIPSMSYKMRELTHDWHDTVRESAIYSLLDESAYLRFKTDDANDISHGYDNARELTASIANLTLSLPGEFGEHVGDLPDNLKQSVLSVVDLNVAKLKELHKDDAEFLGYIDKQYQSFLTKAGVPATTTPNR